MRSMSSVRGENQTDDRHLRNALIAVAALGQPALADAGEHVESCYVSSQGTLSLTEPCLRNDVTSGQELLRGYANPADMNSDYQERFSDWCKRGSC